MSSCGKHASAIGTCSAPTGCTPCSTTACFASRCAKATPVPSSHGSSSTPMPSVCPTTWPAWSQTWSARRDAAGSHELAGTPVAGGDEELDAVEDAVQTEVQGLVL